jgi:transcriptional regulator with XRE-family HTH domain
MALPERLRQLRRQRGMTQAQLADAAGVTRLYVLRIEAWAQDPTSKIIEALARALQVKPGELFEQEPVQDRKSRPHLTRRPAADDSRRRHLRARVPSKRAR